MNGANMNHGQKMYVTFKLLLKLTLILLTFCSAFHPPNHLYVNILHTLCKLSEQANFNPMNHAHFWSLPQLMHSSKKSVLWYATF